jgi:hypothetical protein
MKILESKTTFRKGGAKSNLKKLRKTSLKILFLFPRQEKNTN